jgi:hypothetical protein
MERDFYRGEYYFYVNFIKDRLGLYMFFVRGDQESI